MEYSEALIAVKKLKNLEEKLRMNFTKIEKIENELIKVDVAAFVLLNFAFYSKSNIYIFEEFLNILKKFYNNNSKLYSENEKEYKKLNTENIRYISRFEKISTILDNSRYM
ncbi:MAG: hypothetical protein IJ638_01375 [Alphaproteobacteria bacterium]|nr:hypothetical protein [Alphaproteobacteria bacterium]